MNFTSPRLLIGLATCLLLPACAVDFDGYVFDDEQLQALDDTTPDGTGGNTGDGDTGDGDTGDGDMGDGTGGGEANPNQTACEDFCETSETTCPFGQPAGYPNADECLRACLEYPIDALECRVFQQSLINASNAAQKCPETLPEGGTECADARPSPCNNFCSGQAITCPFGQVGSYASRTECLNFCEGYDEEQRKCRQTHLNFAVTGDPKAHCPHTLPDGGGQCPDATPVGAN